MKLATKRKDDMFHIAVTTIGKIGLTCLTVKGTFIQDPTATWWKGGPRVLGPFYRAIILYPSRLLQRTPPLTLHSGQCSNAYVCWTAAALNDLEIPENHTPFPTILVHFLGGKSPYRVLVHPWFGVTTNPQM